MMTGNLVWLLYRAHRDGLSGAIEVRAEPEGETTARVFLRGRKAVHIEGIDGLLDDLAPKLPSRDALTGELANDVPVCMALGLGLDEVFEAACAGLGRGLAALAQDPGLHCAFNPDTHAPGGAFPLPREALRCFHQGLRAVRDADVVALELQSSLDNPIRLTSEDVLEDFGAVVLRTIKLARTESTLRGLVAASGRGQPERTREAWFAVDLLMQLGLLQVEGSPVARASAATGERARARRERISETVLSAVPDRPAPPPTPPRQRLEADEEADDVFAMGEDTGDLDLLEESADEEVADEPSGASHTISWPTAGGRRKARDVQGGLHESDDEAGDVFAMGGDEDYEELGEESIEYLEGEVDEDSDEGDFDSDEEDLDSDEDFVTEADDEVDDDPSSISTLIDVAEEDLWEEDDDFEDDLDDDDLAETTLDQDSEPPRLRPLPDAPEDTSSHDPMAGLDHPDAAALVRQFRALREANPLAAIGVTLDEAAGYVTLPMLRRKAHLASGRWHPERYADEVPDVQQAASELFSLVERRWAALKDPSILTRALREWRAQLPPSEVSAEDMDRSRHLYGRARQQATANAWTAALLTVGEALEANPDDLKCRLLDLHCRVVLEEFDVDSALANLDALDGRDDRETADREHTAGLILKAAGRADEAVARWEAALALDPKHASARRELDEAGSRGGGKFLSGIFGKD